MVNESIAVCFMDDNLFKINSYMNMFFSCLIPFIALITSSSLVIYSMTILRRRISQTNSAMFKKRKKRDLQFARTILLLDIIFLIFNFPFQFFLIVLNYFPDVWYTNSLYNIEPYLLYLYYIRPGFHFFIYIIFNINFRSEFFKLIETTKTS